MKCKLCSGHGKRRDQYLVITICPRCNGFGKHEGEEKPREKTLAGRPSKYPDSLVAAVLTLHNAGKTFVQIQREVKIPLTSLYYLVNREKTKELNNKFPRMV